MAAVIGFQSPYNDQRSVIALLADSPRGYEMLNDAVNDSGKRATMFGSVAVIRESGINSLRVGDVYYVGHLPWFERLWYAPQTIRFCWRCWRQSASCCWHGYCGVCCVLSAVVVLTRITSN